MAIKAEDIRISNDGYVDFRYPGTTSWVRAVAPMRVAGGQDVKLIEEQSRWLQGISEKFIQLETILIGLNSNQEVIGKIPTALKEYSDVLETVAKASQDSNNKFAELKLAFSQLEESLDRSFNTFTQTISQLSTLPETLSQLQRSLDVFAGIKQSLESLQSITNFHEEVIQLTANEEKGFAIPENTKSLTFRGRKYLDSNNRWQSQDIRWSFTQNGTTGRIYQTLFAWSEESRSGVSLKDKVLYLRCERNLDVEIICGY